MIAGGLILAVLLLSGAGTALAQDAPAPARGASTAAPSPGTSVALPAVPTEPPLSDFGIAPGAAPAPLGPVPTSAPAAGIAQAGGAAQDVERVVWNRTPIRIVLQVGAERAVHFPAPVRVGIPQAVSTVLRTQAVAGTVYWLARAPFEPVRVQVRETASGRTYLLDVEAVTVGASTAPVQVLVAEAPVILDPPPTPGAPGEAGAEPSAAPEPPRYDYVTLTRYAAQQLYAPERLLQDLPGVARVPVRRKPLALYEGGAVQAVPEIAWSDGTLYVTAVRLTNRTRQPLLLDPRALRGRWLARTLLYSRLEPANDPQGADTAMVFLLSPRPFEENF